MKYKAAYKCLLCGTVHLMGEAQEIPYESLPDLCRKVILNQNFMNNPYLYQAPMHLPCRCGNGDCGMAYFAGFKVVDRNSRKEQPDEDGKMQRVRRTNYLD